MNPIRVRPCPSVAKNPDPECQLQCDELWGAQPWFIVFMAVVVGVFYLLTLPFWITLRLIDFLHSMVGRAVPCAPPTFSRAGHSELSGERTASSAAAEHNTRGLASATLGSADPGRRVKQTD